MENKPKRKLTNMQIHEVSVVKSPANSQPFLFMKSEDDKKTNIIKLDGPVTVTFESDGKAKGTTIVVNGVALKKVDSFSLYYSKPGDEGIDGPAVSVSYSRKKEEDGGFKGVETYWLQKNKGENPMLNKFVELMKKVSGDAEYTFVRKDGELSEEATEAIQKALDVIGTYTDDAPEDLKKSLLTITEYAASAIPVEKEVDENADTDKKEVVEKDDAQKEKDEVKKDDKEVKTETEKSADEKKTEDKELAKSEEILTLVKELKDSMKALDSRIETVEKSTGAPKRLKGQEVQKDGVKFPSLLDLN